MTIKQKIQLVNQLIKHFQELNSNFDSIYKLFGSADSKFYDSVWNAFDSYVDSVSIIIEDKNQWLPWFIWDNECGERKFESSLTDKNGRKKKFKVDSVQKLVKLIEEDNKLNS